MAQPSQDDAKQAAKEQTFLFADLAGYAALTEAHGDEHAADAAAAFVSTVRALLDDYSAEEIKTIGDALLVRVPDANDAVRLAARLVTESAARHQALRVRVGMHTGPAVQRDHDWFGAAVNLAARVAEAAEAGQVLMTAATHDAARELLPEHIHTRGPWTFRHIREPVEITSLVLNDPGSLPIDPVCRMAVDPSRSPERELHRSREYHFCSPTCHIAFVQDPGRYLDVHDRPSPRSRR